MKRAQKEDKGGSILERYILRVPMWIKRKKRDGTTILKSFRIDTEMCKAFMVSLNPLARSNRFPVVLFSIIGLFDIDPQFFTMLVAQLSGLT